MRLPKFRIRTLMVAVAVAGICMAVANWLEGIMFAPQPYIYDLW